MKQGNYAESRLEKLHSRKKSFELIDKASADDLSDVEGDALEDFGFNDRIHENAEYDNRFENELTFSWNIKNFSEKVEESIQTLVKSKSDGSFRVCSPIHEFATETSFKQIKFMNPYNISLENDVGYTAQTETIKWQLLFYPAGNPSSDPSCFKKSSSVFLAIANATDLPSGFSVVCKIDFVAVNPNRSASELGSEDPILVTPGKDIIYSCENTFASESTDWGFSQFTTINCLEDLFCIDDELLLVCRVRQKYNIPSRLCYDSRKATNKIGLKNLGATCYLNSLLQTLFFTNCLKLVVYKVKTRYYFEPELSMSDNQNGNIMESMQRLFYELEVSQVPVDTKSLTRTFGWTNFDLFLQHDVQELNRQLCDKLETGFKEAATAGSTTEFDKNIIQKLFMGKYKSYIQCINVDYESSKEEEYYDLQLDVKNMKNVYESFENYIKVDKLDGDNKYFANDELGKQDAEKGIKFLSFPRVLNLHLKRFQYNMLRDTTEKINDRYEFPLILDLSKYTKTNSREVFILQSVLVHSGNVNAGHYYAYINTFDNLDLMKLTNLDSNQQEDYLSSSCTWFKFDDENVIRIKQKRVIEGTFGGELRENQRKQQKIQADLTSNYESNNISSASNSETIKKCTNAYMLVYMKISKLQFLLPTVSLADTNSTIGYDFQDLIRGLKSEIDSEEADIRRRNEEKQLIQVHLVFDSNLKSFEKQNKRTPKTNVITKSGQTVESVCIDFLNIFEVEATLNIKTSATLKDLYAELKKNLGDNTSQISLWAIEVSKHGTFRVKTRLDESSTIPLAQAFSQSQCKASNLFSSRAISHKEYLNGNDSLSFDSICQQIKIFVRIVDPAPTVFQSKRLKFSEKHSGSSDDDDESPTNGTKIVVNIKNKILIFVKWFVQPQENSNQALHYCNSFEVSDTTVLEDIALKAGPSEVNLNGLKAVLYVTHTNIIEESNLKNPLSTLNATNGDIIIFQNKDLQLMKLKRFILDKTFTFLFHFTYFSLHFIDNVMGETSISFEVMFDIRLNLLLLIQKLELEINKTIDSLNDGAKKEMPLAVDIFLDDFKRSKQLLIYLEKVNGPVVHVMKAVSNIPLLKLENFYDKYQKLYFSFSPVRLSEKNGYVEQEVYIEALLCFRGIQNIFPVRGATEAPISSKGIFRIGMLAFDTVQTLKHRILSYISKLDFVDVNFGLSKAMFDFEKCVLNIVRLQRNKQNKLKIMANDTSLAKLNCLELKPNLKRVCDTVYCMLSFDKPSSLNYCNSFKETSDHQVKDIMGIVHLCSRLVSSETNSRTSTGTASEFTEKISKYLDFICVKLSSTDTLADIKDRILLEFNAGIEKISLVGFSPSCLESCFLLDDDDGPLLRDSRLYPQESERDAESFILQTHAKLTTITLGLLIPPNEIERFSRVHSLEQISQHTLDSNDRTTERR